MFPGRSEKWLPGALSKKQMKQLYLKHYIGGIEDFERSADYSSMDLHISNEGYRMKKGSIKPFSDPYDALLDDTDIAEKLVPDSDNCYKLEQSNCYVFKLKETLYGNLQDTNIHGRATAKSSIGRLDVISRLIVDGMPNYEYFDSSLTRATSNMFIEIIPISFGIRVKEGISLVQLRLFNGDPDASVISDSNFIKDILIGCKDGDGYLTVDLSNTSIRGHDVAALCACDNIPPDSYIDIWNKDENEKPCPTLFWQFIRADLDKRLKLETGKFYILRSKERIALPPGVAVYARAMDETLGEMRIHYAGFVHPFFGLNRDDGKEGTPLIFEVRAHNVDVTLRDGERLAQLNFYRMSDNAVKDPTKKSTKYNEQELTLSKYFADWPEGFSLDTNGRIIQCERDV